jgi:hypothetical protein
MPERVFSHAVSDKFSETNKWRRQRVEKLSGADISHVQNTDLTWRKEVET